MKKMLFEMGVLAYSGLDSAQWAVLGQSVLDEVKRIRETGSGKAELTKFATQAALNSTFQRRSQAPSATLVYWIAELG